MTPLASLIFAAALGQASPAPGVDFSGTWILDPARSYAVKTRGSIERGPIKITQNDTMLQVSPLSGQTETVTSVMANVDRDTVRPEKGPTSYWEGSALVTEHVVNINDLAVTVKKRRTLAANGSEMVVDTTTLYHHGYTPGKEKVPQGNSRDVYVRTSRQATSTQTRRPYRRADERSL